MLGPLYVIISRLSFLQLTEKGRREKKKKAKKELSEHYKIIQEEVRNGKNNFAKTTYTSDYCPKEVFTRTETHSVLTPFI